VALHPVLVVTPGGVLRVKTADDGEQIRILWLERCNEPCRDTVFGASQYLRLIDQVDVAAQGRRGPRILRHTDGVVRQGMGGHAHTPRLLRAVYAGQAMLVHKAAPDVVC